LGQAEREFGLEPRHGEVVAADGVLVRHGQVARADAVRLEAADLAVAGEAVDEPAVAARGYHDTALDLGPERHLLAEGFALVGGERRRGDRGDVAADAREVLAELEQDRGVRIDPAKARVVAVGIAKRR